MIVPAGSKLTLCLAGHFSYSRSYISRRPIKRWWRCLILCCVLHPFAFAEDRSDISTPVSNEYLDHQTAVCPDQNDSAIGPERSSIDEFATRIANEIPGGIAERVYFWYTDGDAAKSSYATVDINGCSGTMIGPNVMMTAGHCGQGNRNALFRMYYDAGTQITESFACEYLLHTWPDTDLNLYWCPANALGENPGDKFGYLDFDIDIDGATGVFDYSWSRSKLSLGLNMYAVWTNPIVSLGTGNESIYSQGVTNNLDYASWHTPNVFGTDYLCGNSGCVSGSNPDQNCESAACGLSCVGGTCESRASRSVGAATNLWSAPGASGSSQLSMDTNRILIGPLSVGAAPEGASRSAIPIADMLYWAATDANATSAGCMPCITPQINEPLLGSLGLSNPAGYYGYVDGDLDGLFDVQHDLELITGEGHKDWYWLGFESNRRNGLWTLHAAANPEIHFPSYAVLDTRSQTTDQYMLALSHDKLNLEAGRMYSIGMQLNVTESLHKHAVRVCFEGTETHCADIDPPISSWENHIINLWAGSNPLFGIYLKNGTQAYINYLTINAQGAAMAFDTHDQRYAWRNGNDGSRALIWPNGIEAPATADWAGAVIRDPSMPLTEDWPLANATLPFDAGAEYRVCFDISRSSRESWSEGMSGAVGVFNNSAPILPSLSLFGIPVSGWVHYCTPWFQAEFDDNELRFGVSASQVSDHGTYLVDNILIEKRGPDTVYVDRAATGSEDGTMAHPYSSIEEGTGAVAEQGRVLIQGGSYPEPLLIERPMTLESLGSPVSIEP